MEPQARSLPLTSEEATRLVCAVPGRHCSEQLGYLHQKVLSANLAVNIFTAKERLYQKVLSAKESLQKVSHTVSVIFLTTPIVHDRGCGKSLTPGNPARYGSDGTSLPILSY
jgi:hypothetical protein